MAKGYGPQSEGDEQYDAPRRQGTTKEQAAGIVDDSRGRVGRRGGKARSYEDRSRDGLFLRIEQVGIRGRSRMQQGALIAALRHHR
jgi:hypothetical protein